MYTSLSFATIYKSLLTKKRGNRQIQGNKFLVGLPDLNLWARLFRLLSKSSILWYKCIALAQQIELSQKSQVVEVRTSNRGVLFDQYDDLFDGYIDAFDEVLYLSVLLLCCAVKNSGKCKVTSDSTVVER